jgi:hypothetical protein
MLALGPVPPTPKTDAVSAVAARHAMVSGDLNPGGVAGGIAFYFVYAVGPSCTGPGSISTSVDNGGGNATGSSDVPESAQLTGLAASTEYAVCFVAENGNGPAFAAAVKFTTAPAVSEVLPPTVDSESSSGVTPFDAVLEAHITPENQATSWHFE